MKARKPSRLLSLFLVLSLLPIVGLGVAGAAPLGQETYTVQKDDNLWNIAEKYLGSGAAYPAIVDATNKKHAEDPTFPEVINPGLIQPGWKLAIPSKEQAEEFMAGYVPLEAKASGKITIYTSVPEKIMDKIRADFEARYPNITLDVFRAGTGKVMAKLAAEMEAGAIAADLLWVAEPSSYEALKDKGVLLRFTPAESAALPAKFRDPDGYYYAGRLINMIVAYNADVEPKPTGWKDLLNPAYKGKVGMATPIKSGAALATLGALTASEDFGWKFYEDMAANGAMQLKSNGKVRDQLATGELAVGIALDYQIRQAKAKGSPVDYVWPAEGAILIPSPVAIFNTSQNPDAARVFVNYVLSKDGQKTLVELGSFIPVRADVDPPPDTPGMTEIKSIPVDWVSIKENTEELKDKFVAIYGE